MFESYITDPVVKVRYKRFFDWLEDCTLDLNQKTQLVIDSLQYCLNNINVNKDTVFSENLINTINQEIIAVRALFTANYNKKGVKLNKFNSLVGLAAEEKRLLKIFPDSHLFEKYKKIRALYCSCGREQAFELEKLQLKASIAGPHEDFLKKPNHASLEICDSAYLFMKHQREVINCFFDAALNIRPAAYEILWTRKIATLDPIENKKKRSSLMRKLEIRNQNKSKVAVEKALNMTRTYLKHSSLEAYFNKQNKESYAEKLKKHTNRKPRAIYFPVELEDTSKELKLDDSNLRGLISEIKQEDLTNIIDENQDYDFSELDATYKTAMTDIPYIDGAFIDQRKNTQE